jgi:hypothetical protein
MRVWARAALVVAPVAFLAACGSVAAPVAAGSHARPAGTRLAAARRDPPAGSRAEAAGLARWMLSRLRLPAGTRRLPPSPVPRAVSEPLLWGGAAAALDVYQLFEVRQPMAAVAAGLAAHAPAGMGQAGTGYLGGPSGVVSREVGYLARQVPAGVDAAQLVVTVAPAGPGGSLVRADAQVIWFPPRTTAEYIDPARYHVLAVTVTIFGPRIRTMRTVVTAQPAIGQLAATLNQSRVQPVQVPGCPAISADYQLAFAVSRDSPPVVVVYATRSPCDGARIRVGGRMQPPLQDEAGVVAVADRLLGVTPGPGP